MTVHFPPDAETLLPRILASRSELPVRAAVNGEPLHSGHVYVAPPDRHLILRRDVIRVVRGPTENGNRPAIDPMFRSAAVVFRERAIGVVLTGNLDDGTAGLAAIKRHGGMAVVQDPADALFPSMPESAIRHVAVDHVVPLEAMAALLQRLTTKNVPERPQAEIVDGARQEDAYSNLDLGVVEDPQAHIGEPSAFSCPDCGGVLWQIRDGDLVRFRCRVGHGWTADGLLLKKEATLDTALWTALRALEESAKLNDDVARRLSESGNEVLRERFRKRSAAAHRQAELLRGLLLEPVDAGPRVAGEAASEQTHEADETAPPEVGTPATP